MLSFIKNKIIQKIRTNMDAYMVFDTEYNYDQSNVSKTKAVLHALLYCSGKKRLDYGRLNLQDYKNESVDGWQDYFCHVKKLLNVKKVRGYNLTRLGRNMDGGYVLLDDFDAIGKIYSFGIADDISWEQSVIDRYHKPIYAFDPTVDGLPSTIGGGGGELKFFKKGIAGTDDPDNDMMTMSSILDANGDLNRDDLLLKMDVEGAEWDFFENTENFDCFKQMTFELHEMPTKSPDMILGCLQKITSSHQAIWVHANNNGALFGKGYAAIPDLLEVTFVRKRDYELDDTHYTAPIELDCANVQGKKDIPLVGWGSKDCI